MIRIPRKEKISSDYDSGAHTYDATRSFYEKGYGGAREAELTGPFVRGSLILDIACGTGRVLPHLNARGSTVASDLSLGMMKVAKKKSPRTGFLRCDAETLPFRDTAFETVYCSRAIKYFHNVDRFLEETSRCLKKGGTCIVVAETSDALWVRLAVKLGLMDPFDVRFRSMEIEYSFRKIGFELISKRCVFFFPHYLYEYVPRFITAIIGLFEKCKTTGKSVMFAVVKH